MILPEDNTIELWFDYNLKKVYFNQNGVSKCFHELPIEQCEILMNKFLSDRKAQNTLRKKHKHINDILEAYAFNLYSDANMHSVDDKKILSSFENSGCQETSTCDCFKCYSNTISTDEYYLNSLIHSYTQQSQDSELSGMDHYFL